MREMKTIILQVDYNEEEVEKDEKYVKALELVMDSLLILEGVKKVQILGPTLSCDCNGDGKPCIGRVGDIVIGLYWANDRMGKIIWQDYYYEILNLRKDGRGKYLKEDSLWRDYRHATQNEIAGLKGEKDGNV